MEITIIIPFYNGHEHLDKLLASVPTEWKVIIVNDKSDKPPQSNRLRTSVLHLDKKGYFTGAVNAGIAACNTDVLILNQDVYFTDKRAFELIQKKRDEGYGMVGEGIEGQHPAWKNGYIHGTFMFVTRKVIDAIGSMNEKYYPLWGSTCEWQLRACRRDFKVLPLRPIPGMVHSRKGNYGSSIKQLLRDNPDKKGLLVRTPPLISVIVPCYNHGRYLPDLVASLIGGRTVEGMHPGQTLQSFEVVIADDCSTDDTAEIAKSLADPWKGIHYVRTPYNGGTSLACNTAIKHSVAGTIARIDGDDMREPFALEVLYDALLQNPHAFVYDDVVTLTPNGRSTKIWKMADYDFNALIYKNQVHAGIMLPREAWAEVGGYPEQMTHGRDDWAFNVALGLKGYCGVHVDSAGYIYRRHGENRTLSNTTPAHRRAFLEQIQHLFPEAYAKEKPMGCCGGRRSPQSQTSQISGGTYSMAKLETAGATGMVLVEYMGQNYGKQTYYGPVTGAPYTFSARANKRWVDRRDLHFKTDSGNDIGLLDMMQNGRDLFRQASNPAPESVLASAEPVVEEPVPAEEAAEIDQAVDEIYIEQLVLIKGVGAKSAGELVKAGFLNIEHILEASNEELEEKLGWSSTRVANLRLAVENHDDE